MDWFGPGVLVSNARHRFHHQVVVNGCTNEWAFAGAPASLVAVDLEPAVIGPPVTRTMHPDTPLPLSLQLASPVPAPAPSPGSSLREYVLPIWTRGEHLYDVHVWVGPEATPADVALAQRAVAAIGYS